MSKLIAVSMTEVVANTVFEAAMKTARKSAKNELFASAAEHFTTAADVADAMGEEILAITLRAQAHINRVRATQQPVPPAANDNNHPDEPTTPAPAVALESEAA